MVYTNTQFWLVTIWPKYGRKGENNRNSYKRAMQVTHVKITVLRPVMKVCR